VTGNWRSATEVAGGPSGSLRFSPFARADLRLFANLGEQFGLVAKNPWLRGTQLRFDVENIFNAKPKVRDRLGMTPVNYQPDLLDPVGRTVQITIRKLFLPTRFQRRAGQGQGGRPE
jgi:outer membrane receptor protein involved in Fe transport